MPFAGYADFDDCVDDNQDKDDPEAFCGWLQDQYEGSSRVTELTAPFVIKDEEKRLVSGPVLVPDEPDSDGDTVSAERIEEVAHKFVEQYGNIDIRHSLNNVGKMVESSILPQDLQIDDDTVVPKGSWMMAVRVTQDDAWADAKSGKLAGFSIMAMPAMKSTENAVEKRVTLDDLGDDWVVNAVSLVEEPAVPMAKWTAIKSQDEEPAEKQLEGSLEQRMRLVAQAVMDKYENPDRMTLLHSTMDDSVVFTLLGDPGSEEKMYQVGYSVDDDGNVELDDDLQEVMVQESIEPIEKQGIGERLKRSLGFSTSSEKAGKVISKNNLEKLRAAQDAIAEILDLGDKEREEESQKSQESSNEEEEEMDEESVKGIVQSEVANQIAPLTEQMQELVKSMGNGAEDASQPEGELSGEEEAEAGSEKSQQEIDDEFKEEVVKQVQKKVPFSNRLTGQDGSVKEESHKKPSDRNALGYRVRR